jgi:RHH-type transcriptional regulator, rel operon repressor / antitoxin RelB
MLTLTLDQDTEYRLSRAAQEAGRPVAELLRVAVLAYLEDLDDAEAADRAYERYLKGEERAFSLEDVERDLGVAR